MRRTLQAALCAMVLSAALMSGESSARPLVAARAVLILGPPGHYKTSIANMLVNGGEPAETGISKPFTTCAGDDSCTQGVFVAYSRQLGMYVIDTPGINKVYTPRVLFQLVTQFLDEFPLQIVQFLITLEHDRGIQYPDRQSMLFVDMLSRELQRQRDGAFNSLLVCSCTGDTDNNNNEDAVSSSSSSTATAVTTTPTATDSGGSSGQTYVTLNISTVLYYNTRNETIAQQTIDLMQELSLARFRGSSFLAGPFVFGRDDASVQLRQAFHERLLDAMAPGNGNGSGKASAPRPLTIAQCIRLVNELGHYFESTPGAQPSEHAIVSTQDKWHPCLLEDIVNHIDSPQKFPRLFAVNRPLFEEVLLSFFRELSLCEVSTELQQSYFASSWHRLFDDTSFSLLVDIASRITSIFYHPLAIIFPSVLSLLGHLGVAEAVTVWRVVFYSLSLFGLYSVAARAKAKLWSSPAQLQPQPPAPTA